MGDPDVAEVFSTWLVEGGGLIHPDVRFLPGEF